MIFCVLRFVVGFLLFRFYIGKRYSGNMCAVLAAVSMIVQPISVAGLLNQVTWGLTRINTWHNSAQPVALLFGICSLFCVFRVFEIWEQNKKISVKWLLLFVVASILAGLGKPSFAQVFLPAITVFCIGYCIKSRFANFKCCLAIAVACIPSLAIMMFQSGSFLDFSNLIGQNTDVSQTLDTESASVTVAWFDVMKYSWGNIPVTLLEMLAFPVYTLLAYVKTVIKDKKIILAWLMWGFGFLEYAALAQGGGI
jgi:hypothetical protein